jgi:hypothetical protein
VFLSVLAGAALLAIPSVAPADEAQTLFHTATVPGVPLVSFDISWVDQGMGLYFLADRSNKAIDIIPMTSFPPVFQLVPAGVNAFAGNVSCNPAILPNAGANDCKGPNGVLMLSNGGTNELWVGDGPTTNPAVCAGPCSTVKVFTVAGGGVPTHIINTGGKARADELCFDPVHHLILIANDAEPAPGPFISFISTDTYQVIGQVVIPQATNGIEQCAWNPVTGKFYLNIPEVLGPGDDTVPGAVVTYTPTSPTTLVQEAFLFAATSHTQLCAGPQGMDVIRFGPQTGNLALGCNAPSIGGPRPGVQNTIWVDRNAPNVNTAFFPDLGGADQVWVDSRGPIPSQHVFVTGGSHLPQEQLSVLDSLTASIDPQNPNPDVFSQQTIFVGFIGVTTRTAHSTAAWNGVLAGIPMTMAMLPVPATGGSAIAGFSSTLCGDAAASGCVAFFAATHASLDGDDL